MTGRLGIGWKIFPNPFVLFSVHLTNYISPFSRSFQSQLHFIAVKVRWWRAWKSWEKAGMDHHPHYSTHNQFFRGHISTKTKKIARWTSFSLATLKKCPYWTHFVPMLSLSNTNNTLSTPFRLSFHSILHSTWALTNNNRTHFVKYHQITYHCSQLLYFLPLLSLCTSDCFVLLHFPHRGNSVVIEITKWAVENEKS